MITDTKPKRAEFHELTPDIIRYCTMECRILSELMEALRDACANAGIVPKQWSGAGWLASALLERHQVPKRPLTEREKSEAAERSPAKNAKAPALRRPERPPEFEVAANLAYVGGRSEVSMIGYVDGLTYQYDLHSAYPAAMLDLPCPLHTFWEHLPHTRTPPRDAVYLANAMFDHTDGVRWCGLPFRRNGLYWPHQGTGWYSGVELNAGRRLGTRITITDLWVARQRCDCAPRFEWVREVYDERRRLGAATRGYPLKLGLNSLYGKQAQRVGRGPYHDAVAAGLITAATRARLIEALAHDPEAIVMVAPDALYSSRPLPLDIGDGLGRWEEQQWPDLFIVQPGVYWSPSNLAAR